MLFGSPSSFAMEAMSEPHLRALSAVWGRMRIRCQGIAIGDYADEHCGLHSAYENFNLKGPPESFIDVFGH